MVPEFLKGFYYSYWAEFHPIRRWEWSIIEKYLGSGKLVLDAGCGNGVFSRKLSQAGAIVHAFDYNPNFIQVAKKYNNPHGVIKYGVGNVEKIDFPSDFFDVTVCVSVIGQCDKNKALQEILRVTKNGGFAIITSTARNIDELDYVRKNPVCKRFYAIKTRFMKLVFDFFSRYTDWRFLFSIVFYPLFWLDARLAGRGNSCVLVIKKE